MIVKYGDGTTEYGPGVSIELSGDEVATAIDAYIVAHGVHVSGPRTIKVNDELCEKGHIYVDPSGFVIAEGKRLSGRGPAKIVSKPTVVCLCGSTRFSQAFRDANLRETLAGNIVLTIGCDMRADTELFADKSERELEQIKMQLDLLHLFKIDLADEVLILNVGGYIGESTRRELDYALAHDKRVRYLEAAK